MIANLVKLSLRFRWVWVVCILALFTVSAISFSKHFSVSDNSLPIWFEANDPIYNEYVHYIDTFGHDRGIIVAFEFEDAFSPDALDLVYRVTERLKKLPDVERITSLTHAEMVEGNADEIAINNFYDPDKPVTSGQIQKIMNDPDWVGQVVSEDRRVAAIAARVSSANTNLANKNIKKQFEDIIAAENTNHIPFRLGGSPITDDAFDRLATRDQAFFLPTVIFCVMLLMTFFFRSFVMILVPVLLQVLVIAFVMATYFMLGFKMNVSVGMVAPILVAVCIADTIHILLEYYHEKAGGLSREDALVAASTKLWWPCLFTAATTLAGFISFQSSNIPPINHLGNMTAFGVAIAFILTIFFMPVLLRFLPEPRKDIAEHVDASMVQRFLAWVNIYNRNYPKTILLIFSVFLMISFWGMSRIRVETNFMEYFLKKEKVRQDIEFLNKRLSGVISYEMIFSPSDDTYASRLIALEPAILRALDEIKKEAIKDPHTMEVFSVVDTLKKLNRAFHEDDPAYYKVPDTRQEAAQLYLVAESAGGSEMDQYRTPTNDKLRLSFKTDLVSSEILKEYLANLKALAQSHMQGLNIDVGLTGYAPMWVWLDVNLLYSQIFSFIMAFVVVSLMMTIVLKSFKIGLISMIPNVVPIFYTMGLMGFLGIHLNVSTVLIAGITVGITVDDTIHYLTRFRDRLQATGDYWKAMEETNHSIGTAIVFTTSILVVSFGVLCLGSFVPSITFGAMSSLTLLLSIFCEVFLTPVLVTMIKPFKLSSFPPRNERSEY